MIRGVVAVVAVVAAVALALSAAPSRAAADAQISARLATGAGAAVFTTTPDTTRTDTAFVFELALRSELLFGEAAIDVVRFGPAIDLRTGNFESFEGALGVTLLLPVVSGWPLWLTAGAGARARAEEDHAAFALATVAFGFRPYNYTSAYAFGLSIYASGRADLDTTARYELTAGIEIDLEFLFAIPFMFIYTAASARDPDEHSRPPT